MSAVGINVLLRAGDALGHQVGCEDGGGIIERARQDERRRLDAAEAADRGRIERLQRLEIGAEERAAFDRDAVHHLGALAHLRVDLIRLACWPVNPEPHLKLRDAGGIALLRRREHLQQFRWRIASGLVAAGRTGNDHQRRDHLGMLQREIEHDRAAHRAANQRGALDLKMLQQLL